MGKANPKKEEEKYVVKYETAVSSQEAQIVGWICPVCYIVYSPYEKICSNAECSKKIDSIIQDYFKGGWKVIKKPKTS